MRFTSASDMFIAASEVNMIYYSIEVMYQANGARFSSGRGLRTFKRSAAFLLLAVFVRLSCPWLPRELESRPGPSHNNLR